MKEPFDVTVNGTEYAIFPEEDGIYTIFKEGAEYIKMQEDGEHWLKLDEETDLPTFDESEEVNAIGRMIKQEAGGGEA